MPADGPGSSPPPGRSRAHSDATSSAARSSSLREVALVHVRSDSEQLADTNDQIARMQEQVARLQASILQASSTANFLVTSMQSVSQQYMAFQQNTAMQGRPPAVLVPAATFEMPPAPVSPPPGDKGKGKNKSSGAAHGKSGKGPAADDFDLFSNEQAYWEDEWGVKCPTPSCGNPGPENGNWCARCRRIWSAMPPSERKGR